MIIFTGSGCPNRDGNEMLLTLRVNGVTTQFWFAADKVDMVKESFLAALEQAKQELESVAVE